MQPIDAENDSTRERLLEAAQSVFAEKGFASASVRDICGLAGVNIAAVNYYFRDKERLYVEAVKSAHACAMAEPPMPNWAADAPPIDKLRDFIGVMSARLLRHAKPQTAQLMLRELTQPTAACAEVVRDSIRPVAEVLFSIIRQLLPDVSNDECFRFGFSVMGQIVFYKQCRPVVRGLIGDDDDSKLKPELIAEHIFQVMRAGIEARLQRDAKS